jgi:hypothetical protein
MDNEFRDGALEKDFQEQALVSPTFNLAYDSGNTKILSRKLGAYGDILRNMLVVSLV